MPSPSPSKGNLFLLGVTGGIGAGKSAVCDILADLGRTVLSADQIAREVAENNPSVVQAVSRTFGSAAYTPEGRLDAHFLSRIVFRSPERLAALNAIIHPEVFRRLDRILARLPLKRRRPYVVVEAALIFESKLDRRLNLVLTVEAPVRVRVARVVKRDNSNPGDVKRRMKTQYTTRERRRRADLILRNDADRRILRARVTVVDTLVRTLASSGPGHDRSERN